jgi:hypothetical protein
LSATTGINAGPTLREIADQVVAAIIVTRQVSEEIAMAMEVRRRTDEQRPTKPALTVVNT